MFTAPSPAVVADSEALADRISGTVSALPSLAGIEADPIRSREHILLSTILGDAWRQGRSLELAELIRLIQNPPVIRIGVMEVDSFFPAQDRFDLALVINGLLASPGFEAWMQSEPLDIGAMQRTPEVSVPGRRPGRGRRPDDREPKITIKPKKTDISVSLVALVWGAVLHIAVGETTPGW